MYATKRSVCASVCVLLSVTCDGESGLRNSVLTHHMHEPLHTHTQNNLSYSKLPFMRLSTRYCTASWQSMDAALESWLKALMKCIRPDKQRAERENERGREGEGRAFLHLTQPWEREGRFRWTTEAAIRQLILEMTARALSRVHTQRLILNWQESGRAESEPHVYS